MHQPQGFVDLQHLDYVCRLHKSLCGLKQALRAWFDRFTNHLLSLGFLASSADPSLFIWRHSHIFIILLVYVNDIIITDNNSPSIYQLIKQLGPTFAMKDLGPLHYFLGLEVHRTNENLFLSQTKYAIDLLRKYKMDGAKPYSSPMVTGNKLSAFDGHPLPDLSEYCSDVGALQYLTWTRPDIAFAVNHVSQFMHKPTNVH